MRAEPYIATDRPADVALHFLHVSFVDDVPEDLGLLKEFRNGDTCQFFQTRAGVVEGHVAPLVENDPGPASHEIIHLRLSLQQSEAKTLVGFAAASF